MNYPHLPNLELNLNVTFVFSQKCLSFIPRKWTGLNQNWACIYIFPPNNWTGRKLNCQNVLWTKFEPNSFIWFGSLMKRELSLHVFIFLSGFPLCFWCKKHENVLLFLALTTIILKVLYRVPSNVIKKTHSYMGTRGTDKGTAGSPPASREPGERSHKEARWEGVSMEYQHDQNQQLCRWLGLIQTDVRVLPASRLDGVLD